MARLLLSVVLGLVLAVLVLWVFQRRLIYLPARGPVPAASAVLRGTEEVTLETEDGLELEAWFLPAGPRTVLVFNGNAGNRAGREPLAAALAGRGFSVLLFDYRGYGENPGRPNEEGLVLDARAALAYLEGRPDVGPIAYFGESLGAAVAVGLAVEDPPQALVLRSPFTSLADVGRIHYPYLPVSLLLWDRFPTLERIVRLETPVLVVAGERDGIVPPGQSRQVFEAAPGPKRFVEIPGADHNDPDLFVGDLLLDEVQRFLEEHL